MDSIFHSSPRRLSCNAYHSNSGKPSSKNEASFLCSFFRRVRKRKAFNRKDSLKSLRKASANGAEGLYVFSSLQTCHLITKQDNILQHKFFPATMIDVGTQRRMVVFAGSSKGDSKDEESEEGKFSYYVERAISNLKNMPSRGSITRCLENYKAKLTLNDFAVIFRELGAAGEWQRSLKLFRYMQRQQWCRPNENIYTVIIGILGREGLLDRCSEIFEEMPDYGVAWTVYSFTALINAYGRNGQYETSLHLLARMKREGIAPALITYNTVITASVKGGLDWEGLLGLFAQMRHEGIQPDIITYNALLSACSSMKLPKEAEMVFRTMNEAGIVPNTVTYKLLVETFKNVGDLERVSLLFEEMEMAGSLPEATAYNFLLEALAAAGMVKQSEAVFSEMKDAGCPPNISTYIILINFYGSMRQYDVVRRLFNEMKDTGVEPDVATYNTLIDVFRRGGCYREVISFFHDMVKRNVQPAMETYEGLMFACGVGGLLEDAKEVFKHIQDSKLLPSVKVFNSLIQTYGNSALYEDAVVTLDGMRDFEKNPDRYCFNSLICTYGRGGLYIECLRMLWFMCQQGIEKNVDTFNGIIESLGRAGELKDAITVYKDLMASECTPNEQTYEILLNMYCTAGFLEKAKMKFHELKKHKSVPGVAAYCQMLSMYAKQNRWVAFHQLLEEMQASEMPDVYMATASLLMDGSTESDWQSAMSIFKNLRKKGVDTEMAFYNSLMDVLWWIGKKATSAQVLQVAKDQTIFPEAFRRTELIWSVDLHRMSIGAAMTALSTWLLDLHKWVMDGRSLPKLSSIVVVRGEAEHRPQAKQYPVAKAVHHFLKDLESSFKYADWNNGRIVSTPTQLKRWLSTQFQAEFVCLKNTPLPLPSMAVDQTDIEDPNGWDANFEPEESAEIELTSV